MTDASPIVEYTTVQAAAADEGWLHALLDAHLTPCAETDARRLCSWVGLGHIPIRFTNRRGRARFSRRGYGISLPSTPGTGFAKLRVGLVLHEAAHVLDRMESGTFGHREKFRRVLRDLVTRDWRSQLKIGNQREIYARHRGPYSLLVSRTVPGKGGKPKETTDKVKGPFSAEDAHEEARMLVNDPRDNVVDIHVFSDSEGQFVGAHYKRGVEYPSWASLAEVGLDDERENDEGRVELPDERPDAALLSGGEEPLQKVVAPLKQRVPKPAVPSRGLVRNVPPQSQAAAGTKRKGAVLELDPGNAERWPASKGAAIVRAAIERERGTASELAKRLTAELNAVGVEFPASLISRLKQGGFLREVQD